MKFGKVLTYKDIDEAETLKRWCSFSATTRADGE